mgnify:CR=1 FL=1
MRRERFRSRLVGGVVGEDISGRVSEESTRSIRRSVQGYGFKIYKVTRSVSSVLNDIENRTSIGMRT